MLTRLISRPLLVVMAAAVVAIGGLASMRLLPVDLFPDLNYPLINVVTHLPAGGAEDVERLVTLPVEAALLGMPGLARLRSLSGPGISRVTVELAWGTPVAAARNRVQARLAEVRLPATTRPRLENIGSSLAKVATYALRGGDPAAVASWAKAELAPRLTALPGVTRIEVLGGGEAALRIDLDPRALQRHHLAASQVADAIRAAHVLTTGGHVERWGRDLMVRVDGRITTLAELRQVVVGRSPEGHAVMLAAVAHLYRGTVPARYRLRIDGAPAVALVLHKQLDASTVTVSREVSRLLAATTPPAGVRIEKVYDQAEIISAAYRNMRNQLLWGALFAVVALVWGLGRHRLTLVIALTLPLALLATVAGMRLLGLGINLMTLAAMTVSAGMLVDDGIVVLENIVRHRQGGASWRQAALTGTREIVAPDIAGTLTTLAAFLPLAAVTGLAGRLFHPFAWTFSLLLLTSLVVSLTLVPVAAAHSHHAPHAPGRWLALLGRGHRRLLDGLLAHRGVALAATVVLLAASAALLAWSPVRFLPLLDESSLMLSYQLAPGTSLAESERVGARLDGIALATPGVATVVRRTGSPEASQYLEGANEGEAILRLAPGADATAVRADLEQRLEKLDGVITRVNEPTSEKIDESFAGLPALFGVTVFAPALPTLYDATRRIEAAMGKVPGIANVVNNTKVGVDELRVVPDRAACARLGVSPAAVAEAVHLALEGERVATTIVDQRPVALFVRNQGAGAIDVAGVRRLLITRPGGAPIPLAQVARVERHSGYPAIEHHHGGRSLTLTAEIDGNPWVVRRRLDRAIAALHLPASVATSYTGEYQQLFAVGLQWLWAMGVAALLVYGIIALTLGNLLDPLVVLVKLPIDFMGAALALAICRQPIDLTVAVGFITLLGVSVNNGITLLRFTHDGRGRGEGAAQAVREAATLRLRPLLLTHMTTLLALVPAALGLGRGPQLLQPLGVMLFGGLTAGTLFTLTLLPVLYCATERWRRPAAEVAA